MDYDMVMDNTRKAKFPQDWLCKGCPAKLGRRLSRGKISILGTNSQEYEIGFNYVDLMCRKCETRNLLFSNVAAGLPDKLETFVVKKDFVITESLRTGGNLSELAPSRKNFFDLSQHHRDKILPLLSEKQKYIYEMIMSAVRKADGQTWGDLIRQIAKSRGIAPSIVAADIKAIAKRIKDTRSIAQKISAKPPVDKPATGSNMKVS
jgi:hypothetical protein